MQKLHTTGRAVVRIAFILAALCLFYAVANAYTVVMRGGKRVEIPSHFVVTASTLTYEVSPGVQITLETAAIDIAATEKANNESPGSFMRRIQTAATGSSAEREISNTQAPATRRTITNRDLESAMLRRRNSELTYETRRKQLGLPSVGESRKQAAAEAEVIARELAQSRAAENESEAYWRSRASALRSEMAAVDAELGYVRRQLDEQPLLNWSGSFATVINVAPFGGFGGFSRGQFPRQVGRRPGIFVGPSSGAQLTGRVNFGGGATRGTVFLNPQGFRHGRAFGSPLLAPPNIIGFGSALWPYDFSYDRNFLITRFNELAATRAGLSARWRELEDEARRAGAPPGWLRP